MAGKIFINYRRDDDPAAAARVRDGLAATFGKANLFMDVDNLLAGQRFDWELAKALSDCDVLVAIIGSRWIELLQTKRKSDDERDYGREEIAEALKRDVVVIPVRVGREGRMSPLPRSVDLPPDIRDLVHYQKHDVSHEHFGQNIQSLVTAIRSVRKSKQSGTPWGRIAVAAIGLIVIAWVGAHFAGAPVPWPFGPFVATYNTAVDLERQARLKAEAEAQRLRDEADARRKADEAAATEARRKAAVEAQRFKDQAETKRLAEEAGAKRKAEEARRDTALAITPGSGRSFRDNLANEQPCPTCPEMVVAPAGSFAMGSPSNEPARDLGEEQVHVSIARPFAVGKYSVTFDEWDACAADGGCGAYKPSDEGWGRGRRPVINVSWNDAQKYVSWISGKTGKDYRLLSEAEREYVTRAGTTTPFWWGSSITPQQANYCGTYPVYQGGGRIGECRKQTLPVESFAPNPWGLYNVHGNVRDWTNDCANDSDIGNPGDGRARTIGNCDGHIARGGAFNATPSYLRSAKRYHPINSARVDDIGFRVARSLTP
jgi:formylglycine-generating enzyme required for sulfatase activity